MLKDLQIKHWTKIVIHYIPFLILLCLLTPKSGHWGDNYAWAMWTIFNMEGGHSHIYKTGVDYMPLYHYVLHFYGKLQNSTDAIHQNIYMLKYITLLCEFLSTLFIFKLCEDKFKNTYKAMFLSLFYLLNIGVIYNNIIWGQVDGIMAFFLIASVYFAYKKKILWTLIFYMLAINMKLQSIIFLPIVGLLLLPEILKKENIKKTILSVLIVALMQFIILFPFIKVGDFSKVWYVVTNSVGKYKAVSVNAYNIWHILLKGNLLDINSYTEVFGLTYYLWGLILFFISSFFALFHFIKPLYLKIIKKVKIEFSTRKMFISCSLIPLLFFFLNTQMHERYAQTAFVFLAVYALLYNRPIPYIIGSIANFLNLEGVLKFFELGNYHTLVFMPWFVACLFLITIILLFFDLYDVKLKLVKTNIIEENAAT
ncbi:MAG: hypothetical protein LBQ22_11510 [Bacteroidales bacterium]|jgi:Gpi18-like mannosyltransferase|nr:hypothetical protein [Bacteroidales bacterium]